jgi:hypothetical protein
MSSNFIKNSLYWCDLNPEMENASGDTCVLAASRCSQPLGNLIIHLNNIYKLHVYSENCTESIYISVGKMQYLNIKVSGT